MLTFLLFLLSGTCCSYGEGGPVELFRGAPKKGNLIFSESFQTGKLSKTFYLMGGHSSATSAGLSSVTSGTLFAVLTMTVLAAMGRIL
jgi:hypothetical protein